MRERWCIDREWRFSTGDFPAARGTTFDDAEWRLLDLPHDWSVEATTHPDFPTGSSGGFFPGGLAWYRKTLDIPTDLGDRRVLIEFDGVYMNSEVWCNGQFVGRRPYGYSSFCYDLTPYVNPGEPAVLAVRVDNSRQKNSRWYSGSGIYRHVWLTLASPVRVAHWGTFVTTPRVSAKSARVECEVTVLNQRADEAEIDIGGTLIGPDGTEVGSSPPVPCRVAGGESAEATLAFEVTHPQLWSPDSPALYTVRATVASAGTVVDEVPTPCGLRTLRFDAETGFSLNGESLKMKGVNEHHDAGCLGAAVPDDVVRRRFRILKEMGCNAIRVAHNPASPTFLDLCDEMGFLVVEDAFDEWRAGKTPFGYQLYWDQWWERDLVDMIRRDRNHPCIALWSVGNEIKELRKGRPEGGVILRELREVCHREDPTRLMTCGCCNSRTTLAAGFGSLMDVFGYNGGGGGCFDYEKDHATYPDMPMFASEVPHTLQTRDVYRTRTWYRDLVRNPNVERIDVPPLTDEEVFTEFDPHYQSSYDNAMVRISAIDSWRRTRDLPYVCGEFRWTGFDYLGECYAWPAKSWNFGVIDLCGFPKDTFHFYRSQWTDEPMVHLLPHWTWPGLDEGTTIPVVVYTNCERVELSLNGESLGEKTRDDQAMMLRWDVPYRPGTLKAVGRRGGLETAECARETAGEPAALQIECDEQTARADGTGIVHACVSVVDTQGRVVPHAGPDVTLGVCGPARLIGLENGDPLDATNYKLDHRRAFNGRMLAVVQAGDDPGIIKISAHADGLASATATVTAD